MRKAAWALLVCRTAVLGGHVQGCPDGHMQRIWYNSCRHRLCPPCAWLQVERWLATQKARLFACEHYHMIFTMPAELHGLWLANVRPMTQVLFATVWRTVDELLGDAKYLGAQPGVIAALHTWSQTLVLHPHVHGVVTGGGLSGEGQWCAVRHGFLRPVRVGLAVFRGKLLAAIDTALRRGQLALPAGMTLRQWETLRNKLGRQRWNVYIRERYPHGEGVLPYLARYIRGGPLANPRLVSCGDGEVTFRYRVNGEGSASPRSRLITWSVAACIRRDLRHVPEPGTRVVRAYGLYAPSRGDDLAVCRAQLGQESVVTPVVLDWQTGCSQRGAEHPERGPLCGRRLVRLGLLSHARIPPPGHGSSQVAA